MTYTREPVEVHAGDVRTIWHDGETYVSRPQLVRTLTLMELVFVGRSGEAVDAQKSVVLAMKAFLEEIPEAENAEAPAPKGGQ